MKISIRNTAEPNENYCTQQFTTVMPFSPSHEGGETPKIASISSIRLTPYSTEGKGFQSSKGGTEGTPLGESAQGEVRTRSVARADTEDLGSVKKRIEYSAGVSGGKYAKKTNREKFLEAAEKS